MPRFNEKWGEELSRLIGNRTYRVVARLTGFSHTAISHWLQGEVPKDPDTVRKIADGLKTPRVSLLQIAGFYPNEEDYRWDDDHYPGHASWTDSAIRKYEQGEQISPYFIRTLVKWGMLDSSALEKIDPSEGHRNPYATPIEEIIKRRELSGYTTRLPTDEDRTYDRDHYGDLADERQKGEEGRRLLSPEEEEELRRDEELSRYGDLEISIVEDMGWVPAGEAEWQEAVIHPHSTYIRRRIKVKGKSMEPIFFDGDLVELTRAMEARHNDFVIARFANELIFKRYLEERKWDGTIVRILQPLNGEFPQRPIRSDEEDFVIEWIVKEAVLDVKELEILRRLPREIDEKDRRIAELEQKLREMEGGG